MIKSLERSFLNNYLLPPTITGGVPPSEPGKPGTTCVLPSHLSMNIKSGNQITFLINEKNEDKAQQWLKDNKFEKTVKTK